jgi:hypothetical protein
MRADRRRALAGLVVLAAFWPAVGRAEEPTSTTLPPVTTVAPDTTLPPTATEPPTTTEAPPTTVVDAATTPVPAAPAAAPEGGPRTLEVTPHNDLVHGQSVLLRGRGWPPHQSGQGAAQCVTGTPDTRGCGRVKFFPVDAAGNFRTHFPVSVILETSIGTFDCRVDDCVIGTNFTPDATGARFVALTFDPAGPDPVRRTADVDPDTGLVDGQTVNVTGDGFEVFEPAFGGFAEIAQCRLPASGRADCDPTTVESGSVDVQGHLDADVVLDAVLDFEDGTSLDCRTGGCGLSVRDYDESFASGALVALDFDPVGPLLPPPTFSVSPDTGVLDGQVLHASGAGWRPGTFLYLVQCRAAATTLDDCSFEDLEYADADENGAWSRALIARAVLPLGDGSHLDCRVEACSVFATRTESVVGALEAPLGYDPTGPLLQPTLTLARSTGLDDGDVIGVGGQGARRRGQLLMVQCVAAATDSSGCDRSTEDWTATHGRDVLEAEGAEGAEPVGVHWNSRFEVHRILHLAGGRTVDCALSPCALVVSESVDDLMDFDRSDRAALGFDRSPLGTAVDPADGPVSASPTFAG